MILPDHSITCLTSASKDGAMIASAMHTLGINAIRGSSSRRGKKAMIEMIRTLKDGASLAITPDGPRGPLYHLNPGAIKLASKSQCPLIPVQVNYADYWELRTWDNFRLPKPFSRVELIFNTPLYVSPSLEKEQELRVSLEELLISERNCMQDGSYEEYRW